MGPMCEKRSGATRSLDERMSELEKCLHELQHEVPGGIELDWMEVEFKERMNLLRQTAQAVVVQKLDLQRHAALHWHARTHQHGGGSCPGPQDIGEIPMNAGGGAPAPHLEHQGARRHRRQQQRRRSSSDSSWQRFR